MVGGTQERDWLTWGPANNDPILGVMFPSPEKGIPVLSSATYWGGNPQVPVLHPRTLSLKRSVASPHLLTLGRWHISQETLSLGLPRGTPKSSNKAQTGWPGEARGHQAETMMGVGRQCKPAVTWSRGSPFLADLRWVGLSLTKGRRTAQRFGVSVERGDGQGTPHLRLEVHRDHTRVWGP